MLRDNRQEHNNRVLVVERRLSSAPRGATSAESLGTRDTGREGEGRVRQTQGGTERGGKKTKTKKEEEKITELEGRIEKKREGGGE